jgi:hypothetical protein
MFPKYAIFPINAIASKKTVLTAQALHYPLSQLKTGLPKASLQQHEEVFTTTGYQA